MSKPRGGRLRRSTTRKPVRGGSDEPALLAGLAAAPADDAPRLVYADWLDDHGEEAKAEYLRLVVRLRANPDDGPAVARGVELAAGLDAAWRQAVGGVFEVAIEAAGPVRYVIAAMRWVLRLGAQDTMALVHSDRPIVMRTDLTREAAEELMHDTGSFEFRAQHPDLVKVYVRAMGFAP